jgi:integrase
LDARIRPLEGGKWKLQGRAGGRQYARTLPDEETAATYLAAVPLHGLVAICRMIDEHRNPDAVDDGMTVEQIVCEFIEKNLRLSETTREDYLSLSKIHIFPFIGQVPAKLLTTGMVEDWLRLLSSKGYAWATVKTHRTRLNAAFSWACKREDIDLDKNPVKNAGLPPGDASVMVCLEPSEVQTLLDTIDPFYRDFILTLVSTGMRYGEATALNVADIKFRVDHAIINIDKAWSRSHKGGAVIGKTKTQQSTRQLRIPVGTPVYDALMRATAGRLGNELLFVNKGGKMIQNAVFHRDAWGPMRLRLIHEHGWNKFPRIHDLRHTAASIMIHNGIPVNAVSAVLGHATVVMTLNTYTHLLSGATDTAMMALSKALAFKEEKAA